MENVGLVLEGGGMRGLYTCGVLEFFMEKDLYFNYIIGVSAGACNAVSYIARQKGRNKKVNLQFAKDWRYMSFRNLLLKKSFFGMDFIFCLWHIYWTTRSSRLRHGGWIRGLNIHDFRAVRGPV